MVVVVVVVMGVHRGVVTDEDDEVTGQSRSTKMLSDH